jgi:membrane protein required for colicin V production
MSYNWVDIAIFVIIALTIVLGILKGFIRQILGIATVILAFVVAFAGYPFFASLFHEVIPRRNVGNFIGFLIVFLVVLLVGFLLTLMIHKLMKGSLKALDHVLGGIFGCMKGLLICGALLMAMLVFPFNKKVLKDSMLAPMCLTITKSAYLLIPKKFRQRFEQQYLDVVGRSVRNEKRI